MSLPRPSGIVTLLSDFGRRDPYVGIMHGMVLRAFARSEVVDLCHEVPPQDVALGSLFWRAAVGRFPMGTVHCAVVDPGVGTERGILCAFAAECYWLAPDNGLLPAALAGVEVTELRTVDLERVALRPTSRTFHGRDLFAPLCGMLAGGRFGFQALGKRCGEPVRIADPMAGPGRVLHVDHFGNLITNLAADAVGAARAVRIGDHRVPLRATYADHTPGELLALINSYDLLEIAVSHGNAALRLGLGVGTGVVLETV